MKLKLNASQRHAYQRDPLNANNTMASTAHDTHARTRTKQHKSVPTFFIQNGHAPRRAPGALQARPCDASGRLQRLPGCVCLGAAASAAAGTAATPQPPLKLLLLLLGCYCEWLKRRKKTTPGLPLVPALAPKLPPPAPSELPPPSLLLLPPLPPPRLPQ